MAKKLDRDRRDREASAIFVMLFGFSMAFWAVAFVGMFGTQLGMSLGTASTLFVVAFIGAIVFSVATGMVIRLLPDDRKDGSCDD